MEILFKAIANEHRREILALLASNNLDSGDIKTQIELSHPAISNHLNILVNSGLVNQKIIKNSRSYSLNRKKMMNIINFLDGLTDGRV